jgi:hypothetical protein
MKNKSIILILTIATIVEIIIILILSNYVNELENQVAKKSELIEQSEKSDSLLIQKTKEYADQINEYVQDCNFYINGKKVSQQEVIRLANKTLDENSKLIDSIQKLKFVIQTAKKNYGISYKVEQNGDTLYATRNATKIDTALAYLPQVKLQQKRIIQLSDSLEIYKWQAELVEKNYGISYKIKREGTTLTSTRNSSTKLDSALVLYKYYKHRLSKDKNGDWIIETDKEYRKMEKEKKKNDN